MTDQTTAVLNTTGSGKGVQPSGEIRPSAKAGGGAYLPSFAQRQLWLLDQLWPGDETYNIPYAVRIRGPLDIDTLQNALDAVVGRQEILRTRYTSRNGKPVSVVAKEWSVELTQVDLRNRDSSDREPEADRLLHEYAVRPFDLAKDLMLRSTLIRLADDEYIFGHVSHHIAWELWSTAVFYRDLSTYYQAIAKGTPVDLPPLPNQYGDYARWQHEHLQGANLEKLVSYWKTQLDGAPYTLDLPPDRPRPAVQTSSGGRYPVSIPGHLFDGARELSLKSGVTPFASLCAAFNVFLYSYTGQQDVLVGSPVAGRSGLNTNGMIGCFVNTVVLRTDLSGAPTFRDLLKRTSRTILGAIAHSHLPLAKIVEAVSPPRDLSRMPLFQINFRVVKQPLEPLSIEGLEIDPPQWIDNHTAKFDLALELVAVGGASGFFEYKTDLFDESTIAQMGVDFERVLGALVQEPDVPLTEIAAVREIRGRFTDANSRTRSHQGDTEFDRQPI